MGDTNAKENAGELGDDVSQRKSTVADSIGDVREGSPLVQAITNDVTINDVANCILHWGALPVMADSPGDAGEMVQLADALVCNTGQVPKTKVDAMTEAAREANDIGVPVVLDPVGVGATETRTSVVASLLSSIDFAAIKGNYGEISTLAGVDAQVKGVESIGEYDAIEETAQALAETSGAVVVASGVEDVVADAERVCRLSAGHELMGAVVGTGCMLGATLAAFCGAADDYWSACVGGTVAFGIAGERAAAVDIDGPASFRTAFLDSIASTTPETVAADSLDGRLVDTD